MRRKIAVKRQSTSGLVEQLESRTLLASDWSGTWQVAGVDIAMRGFAPAGAIHVTRPSLTVSVTETSPGSGLYNAVLHTSVKGKSDVTVQMTVDSSGALAFSLPEQVDPTEPTVNGNPVYEQVFYRMMKVDDAVRFFDVTSVGYTSVNGVKRIVYVDMYSGVAAQAKLPVVSFPYAGNYVFHGFQMEVSTDGGTLHLDAAATEPAHTAIKQTSSRNYTIDSDTSDDATVGGDPTAPLPFRDQSATLLRDVAGNFTGIHGRYLQMYFRGPDGRLYYRCGGMEANINAQLADAQGTIPLGQILHAWTVAGYSDVAPQNFAPVMAPAPAVALNPIQEDQTLDRGTSVWQIVNAASITDWNSADPKGIAIVSLDSSKGAWQYSTNSGLDWQAIGKVSAGNALLLVASTENLIRFVPKLNYNGSLPKAVGFRAWDRTTGANGTYVSAAKVGNLTAFSATRNYASLQVTPVNDPPVLSGTLPVLTYNGQSLHIASGLKIADVDNTYLSGAIVTITSGDILAYAGTVRGITLDPTSTTTMLVLKGKATLAAYVAAIRAITFTGSSTAGAGGGECVISITVQDEGGMPSNSLNQMVDILPAVSPMASPLFSDTLL